MPLGPGSRSTTSSTEGKRDLLKAIRGATLGVPDDLEPTGSTARAREDYLARFRRVNRPAWPFLPPTRSGRRSIIT